MSGNLIQSRAMLAHLSISSWKPRVKDAAISKKVADLKGATPDAGSYVIKLSDASVFRDIERIEGKARNKHYELSLPWFDKGFRILSNTLFFTHLKAMNELKTEFMGNRCAAVPGVPGDLGNRTGQCSPGPR